MHHSYTEGVCVVGVLYLNLNAVFFDRALLRLIEPEQNAHKRTLSRAVFTQQRMDFTLFELKGNVVVGNNAREAFCYMQHFNCIFLFQTPYLPFRICLIANIVLIIQ